MASVRELSGSWGTVMGRRSGGVLAGVEGVRNTRHVLGEDTLSLLLTEYVYVFN